MNIRMILYGDKETADRIWDEINFCRQMHELRPLQQESKTSPKKKVLVAINNA